MYFLLSYLLINNANDKLYSKLSKYKKIAKTSINSVKAIEANLSKDKHKSTFKPSITTPATYIPIKPTLTSVTSSDNIDQKTILATNSSNRSNDDLHSELKTILSYNILMKIENNKLKEENQLLKEKES